MQITDNQVWYLAKVKSETVLCLSDAGRQFQVVSDSKFLSLMLFVKYPKLNTICQFTQYIHLKLEQWFQSVMCWENQFLQYYINMNVSFCLKFEINQSFELTIKEDESFIIFMVVLKNLNFIRFLQHLCQITRQIWFVIYIFGQHVNAVLVISIKNFRQE